MSWKKDIGGWTNPKERVGGDGGAAPSSTHQTPGLHSRGVPLVTPGSFAYDPPPRGVAGQPGGTGVMSPRDTRAGGRPGDIHPLSSHGTAAAIQANISISGGGGGGFFGALSDRTAAPVGGPGQSSMLQQQQQPSIYRPPNTGSPSRGVGGGGAAGTYNNGAVAHDSPPLQENQKWVTAFGVVPSDVLPALEQLELQFGRIVRHVWPGGVNCNWVHVEFESTFDAQRAVYQKEIILTSLDVRIGVAWCREVEFLHQFSAGGAGGAGGGGAGGATSPFRNRSIPEPSQQRGGSSGSAAAMTTTGGTPSGRIAQIERARVTKYKKNRSILNAPKTFIRYFLGLAGGEDRIAGEGIIPGVPDYLSWNFLSFVLIVAFTLWVLFWPEEPSSAPTQ